ncbi:polar growth protein [Toensbergia leucococca]|nr:polar growth protein [Toensbergia leucococca]
MIVYTRANNIFPIATSTSPSPRPSLHMNDTTQTIQISKRDGQSPILPISPHEAASRNEVAKELYGPGIVTPPPLNTTPSSQKTLSSPISSSSSQAGAASLPVSRSIGVTLGSYRNNGEDSPVMNETLSVIDEHITDMNTPRSSLLANDRGAANDSGSEYSSHIDHRLSYIAGHETDEEERNAYTAEQVLRWKPNQVAKCLKDIGVESRHCEIFEEQEISGEVLLSMDQASIFMKEFDLGLVGRRLRTWHKIKALQEEVRTPKVLEKKDFDFFGDDGSSEGSKLPRIPGLNDHFRSRQMQSQQENLAAHPSLSLSPSPSPSPSPQLTRPIFNEAYSTPVTFTIHSGPGSPRRPSAASIRELNHFRRHSAVDVGSTLVPEDPTERTGLSLPSKSPVSPHKKQPSLDRSWTMGVLGNTNKERPTSALGLSGQNLPQSIDRNTFDPNLLNADYHIDTLQDLDRGYSSGGEVENKKTRNVLRKRDASSATHSRHSSYQEEHRRTSFTVPKRHSRFGSMDSVRDTVAAVTSPASKLYYGNSFKGRFRNSSITESNLQAKSQKELSTPTVTKLEYDRIPSTGSGKSSPKPNIEVITNGQGSPRFSKYAVGSTIKPRMSLRAISDAVTGSEKASLMSPSSMPSPVKESPVLSPTRTGSTTPSGASKSFEFESTDASSKGTNGASAGLTPTSGTTRRKAKKETSAYTRGLEKKSPQEQMVGCDYSGWMKKKSSNLMTTWKPRLFVLRGRRLSYYYSDTDTQEKGLIDISFHRVLPADNDRITGIHATVTGAKASPIPSSSALTPTIASTEAAAQPESTLQKSRPDNLFIFKLVPPRTGLSRAVNFTKPTIHYFAVENIMQGRLWMAALMKATIDRDETKPITTTFQQKTISLAKARALRHRPPALMGLTEKGEGNHEGPKSDSAGLNIQGLGFQEDGTMVEHKKANSLELGSHSATPPIFKEVADEDTRRKGLT